MFIEPAVKLGRLESLLTGREYGAVVDDPRTCALLASRRRHRVIVVTTTDSLVGALADLGDERLESIADAWAATEEMTLDRIGADVAQHLLRRLRALAREARGHGHRLYCWIRT